MKERRERESGCESTSKVKVAMMIITGKEDDHNISIYAGHEYIVSRKKKKFRRKEKRKKLTDDSKADGSLLKQATFCSCIFLVVTREESSIIFVHVTYHK